MNKQHKSIPVFGDAHRFGQCIAIRDQDKSWSYDELISASNRIASALLQYEQTDHLGGQRIAFMITPGFSYVAVQWGIWQAGGIAVPLCLSYPESELQYVIESADCFVLVSDALHQNTLELLSQKMGRKFYLAEEMFNQNITKELPGINLDDPAMILYTSGTTSKPKGVVISHGNIEAQMNGMIDAWGWTESDQTLNVLPLHHVHGIVNVVTTALRVGASVDFLPKFDAAAIWSKFINDDLTVFMAVPTVYHKLIDHYEKTDNHAKQKMSNACSKFRLMISGSAALPVTVLEKWKLISGHTLLERYGMTEIGMALTNPLNGERRPGHVGQPFPHVEVRLVNAQYEAIPEGEQGELLIKGPNVFKAYWDEPEITKKSFVDGWFKTGDIAVLNDGYYKIIGRSSVDIIKSGGYKISALEIEEVLRIHPAIKECAVVGIPDDEWGEIVGTALVGETISIEDLQDWLKDKLAPYKIPRLAMCVNELPRNALGKVVKPKVKKLFEDI